MRKADKEVSTCAKYSDKNVETNILRRVENVPGFNLYQNSFFHVWLTFDLHGFTQNPRQYMTFYSNGR